jgi:hypothetical protein
MLPYFAEVSDSSSMVLYRKANPVWACDARIIISNCNIGQSSRRLSPMERRATWQIPSNGPPNLAADVHHSGRKLSLLRIVRKGNASMAVRKGHDLISRGSSSLARSGIYRGTELRGETRCEPHRNGITFEIRFAHQRSRGASKRSRFVSGCNRHFDRKFVTLQYE